VVHAGLDILRSELSCLDTVGGLFGQMSDSTAELIEDIYTASETAIAILNDLLHYEHMDAGTKSVYILVDNIKVCTPGTFQLEQVKRPLNGLLEGKLHWATILAAKKKINLAILDYTVATNSDTSTLNRPDESNVSYRNASLDDASIESMFEVKLFDHIFCNVFVQVVKCNLRSRQQLHQVSKRVLESLRMTYIYI